MDLYIIGCGGHGKVVYDLAKQTNQYNNIYFLDDNSNSQKVKGKIDDFYKFIGNEFYIAIGNNELRITYYNKLKKSKCKIATIIHDSAYISPTAIIKEGCIIMPNSIVNTNTIINECSIINVGAIIDHDCVINRGCHIGPGAIVKGYNIIPANSKIDAGTIIALNYYK